ncbi:M20 family metallopeptidase [Burkholderia gladioli]|uniref:M20 family metallopeptidase n=1 Tax=Burkholderia gladioli TaxID=28095 RepID=UPI00164073CF|nr:M20 family metallopeptidase [Burkholderia gladioli]MBJ9711908.1 M20 family metallopeptidase [Burkholderia gladioli]MCH7273615.1 M20 family metallopeptidase [Burkholderia gladioli]MDZ4041599.1 M20 family metallopeptidase [Burkholderia gladioli pv. alliicola]
MDTVIELTRALIAQDTSDPPGNEARAARVIAEALRAGGIEPHVYEVAPGRTNLVARILGAGRRPSLAFSAHFDTIGVDPGQWRVDPFAGEIRNGRLHGRGASDMKGGMAAMTIAALELQRDAARLEGDLLLTFSAAENSNCLGARRLLADGHFAGVGALLISEPTGNRAFVTEKGALWIRATAHGEYGHNAFSEYRSGDRGNAIVRLARYLDQAHDLRLAAPVHRHVGAPTINVGMIRGGKSTPLIPAQASADIDVRLVPGQSPELVIEAFRSIAGPHITIEALDIKVPVDTPDSHPFVVQCIEACRAEGVSDPGPGGVGYYSDGAVIAPPLNLPMVIIGPGEVGMSGAVDEYIDISKLETSVRIFERIARAYIG